MSHTIRVSTALLMLALLACGAVSAFPLGARTPTAEGRAGTLNALVDWIEAFFSWDRHHGTATSHVHPKGAFTIDPNGGH
jgi:hypothetical protein